MFEGLFQPMHLLLILAIAIVFFGPKKLPEIGEGLGRSIREFKKAISDSDKAVMDVPAGHAVGAGVKAESVSEKQTSGK
jgi:sec-independent protein translocase protein TatA